MHSTLTIAIAEDNLMLREELERSFTSKGLQVIVTAENGKDLIDQLMSLDSLPQILLCDIQMPVMNGYETMRYIRSNYPTILIVAFSTDSHKYTAEQSKLSGADAFIPKFSGMDEYLSVFRNVISQCAR
jgi:DNA-binding NarL/FixJ family response regulator